MPFTRDAARSLQPDAASNYLDVRCGHTHTAWAHSPMANLAVNVGGACHRYRDCIASLTTFDVS